MDFKNTKKYREAVRWRDWQTCDLICEEHDALVAEIDRLKSEIDKKNMLLERVSGMCGHPDAAQGCRNILKLIRKSL